MSQTLSEINNELVYTMGWDDGFRIPVANEENKKLENIYLDLQKQMTVLKSEVTEQNDRLGDMQNHFKNVKSEISNCHALTQAKANELNTEDHISKINAREIGRLEQEIIKIEKEIEQVKEKKNSCENSKFKLIEKIEAKKDALDMNEELMDEWLEECRRRDENAMVIEKYARQDEARIRDINMKISNLTEEITQYRRRLDLQSIETESTQYAIDKTAEDYRRVHQERQEVIERWRKTMEQMKKKDADIEDVTLKITLSKRDVSIKELEIKERDEFLSNERKLNEQLDYKIKMAEGVQQRVKQNLMDVQEIRDNVKSELIALKQTLDRTANDLEVNRGQVKVMKRQVKEKNERLKSIQESLEDLKKQEKELSGGVMDANVKRRRLEESMESEEKLQRKLEMEAKTLNALLFKRQQQVQALNEKKKNVEIEIQNAEGALKNLTVRLNKVEEENVKQTKIMYNQDYSMQALEKKMSRLKGGDMSTEERRMCEERLAELTVKFNEDRKTADFINSQNQQLVDDLKRLTQEFEKVSASKLEYFKRNQEIELKIEVAGKMLKSVIAQKQDRMVHEHMKKLELKRLRDSLFRQADENANLDRDMLMVKSFADERMEEVKVIRRQVTSQFKMADDDVRRLTAEFQERVAKIGRMRNRYEIVVMKMSPSDSEDSIISCMVKSVQEKEELKARGDQLNEEILMKERELKAFENTIRLVAGRNDVQRSVLCRGSNPEEESEKNDLDDQLKLASEETRFIKNKVHSFKDDINRLMMCLSSLEEEGSYLEMVTNEKQQELMKAKKELSDQQIKLERVQKMTSKYMKEVEAFKKSDPSLELNMDLKELKLLNRLVVNEFNNLFQQQPELVPTAQQYLNEAGIILNGPKSTTSLLNTRSSTLLSLRSSQIASPTSSTSSTSRHGSRLNTPSKVNSVMVTIQDMVLPIKNDSKPVSRSSSRANLSRHSSTTSIHSLTNKKR